MRSGDRAVEAGRREPGLRTEPKREYRSPTLTRLGTVRELTQGLVSGSVSDGRRRKKRP
jgi:hypothetical protein